MTSNQYRVYYKGLRKRPTYEGLINYLANEQEMIQYPDRTAKQMRNHPYLTQLDGDDYDHMTEQQLNILRAKMNEDKINEQAAKPGGPGTNVLNASAGASSSSSSIMSGGGGSASSGGYESIAGSSQASRTGRPLFLPRSGSDASGSRRRGSAVARPTVHDMASPRSSRSSAASSPHLQDNDALIRAQMAEQERLNRQYEEEEKARIKQVKDIAREGLIQSARGDAADRMMQEQQAAKRQQYASSSSAPAVQQSASSSSAPAVQQPDSSSASESNPLNYFRELNILNPDQLEDEVKKKGYSSVEFKYQCRLRGLKPLVAKRDNAKMIMDFDRDPKNKNYRPDKKLILQAQAEFDIDPTKYKQSVGELPK
jgi:hypothetical protein